MKLFRFFLFFLFLAGLLNFAPRSIRAEDYGSLDLENLQRLLDQKIAEEKTVRMDKEARQQNISEIKALMDQAGREIEKRKLQIKNLDSERGQKEADLAQKVEQRNSLVAALYKMGTVPSLNLFLSNRDFAWLAQNLTYYKVVVADRQSRVAEVSAQIVKVKVDILSNRERKAALEKQVASLTSKKALLDQKLKELTSQLTNIQGEIAQISARQRQLLAEKEGGFATSVGDVPDTQDPNSSIEGFRSSAPSGSFAAFSFGAPHRKGMSQYGAYGRAKNGQSAEDILRAYYGSGVELKKDYSTGINISVRGFGSYNIEEYVKRIYEVPNSWGDSGGMEALKAQAVAARSYALAYTGSGAGSICATESCQVFQSGKKGGKWEEAVNATRGWVLTSGGKPFSAWYAATSGGYNFAYTAQGSTTSGGWDTRCGNKDCWTNDAYEKIAASPWFYKAWYKPRYRSASRSNAWLSKDEFVDIVNAVLLYNKDSGTISHLSQPDKANPDTWKQTEVRRQLGGDVIDSVNGVSVIYSAGGYTSSVHLDTDKGGREVDGATFRQIFNMRAPGEIWLASSLFNIEKK